MEFGVGRARSAVSSKAALASSFQTSAARNLFGHTGRPARSVLQTSQHSGDSSSSSSSSRGNTIGPPFSDHSATRSAARASAANMQSSVARLAQGGGSRRRGGNGNGSTARARAPVAHDDDELDRMMRQFHRENRGGAASGTAAPPPPPASARAAAEAPASGGCGGGGSGSRAQDREASIASFAERARARRADVSGIADAHAAYQARWHDFVANPPAILSIGNVPWPPAPPAPAPTASAAAAAAARSAHQPPPLLPRTPLETVADLVGLAPTAAGGELKAALRAAALRWHPDKFVQAFGARLPAEPSVRGAILARVSATMQRVTEAKSRWQTWLADERDKESRSSLVG